MPKISKNAIDNDLDTPISKIVEDSLSSIAISTVPVFICGVNRKINIGNYENIDVYAGIALPIDGVSLEDREQLALAIQEVAAYGFNLVSKETGERYYLIKEAQAGK
jgi:hypothetical protein